MIDAKLAQEVRKLADTVQEMDRDRWETLQPEVKLLNYILILVADLRDKVEKLASDKK
jgi:hypothetical protein